MRYSYSAYGMHLESEVELPLVPQAKHPGSSRTIQIVSSEIKVDPDTLTQSFGMIRYQVEEEQMVFLMAGIATCRVAGERIKVQIQEPGNLALAGMYLVHFVLLFVVKREQQGVELFHGSGVSLPGSLGAVIFLGAKGSGKSTIASALTEKGCRILCDDIIPILPGNMVSPGIPLVKLNEDASRCFNRESVEVEDPPDNSGKSQLQLPYASASESLRMVCFLETGAVDHVTFSPLSGREKVSKLLQHLISIRELRDEHAVFKQVTAVAGAIPMCRVVRPVGFIPPTTLAESCLNYIHKEITT